MSVIINDFEVVVEQPSQAPREPGVEMRQDEESPPPGLSPAVMDDVLRQRLERMLRVRAE